MYDRDDKIGDVYMECAAPYEEPKTLIFDGNAWLGAKAVMESYNRLKAEVKSLREENASLKRQLSEKQI